MDLLLIVLVSAAVGLMYQLWRNLPARTNLPPGPSAFWVWNQLLKTAPNEPHLMFDKAAALYGNIFSFYYGLPRRTAVVLNEWTVMKEAILHQSETFAGRGQSYTLECFFYNEAVLTSNGPAWKNRKRCIVKSMRDLGVAKTPMEDVILKEIDKMKNIIDSHDGREMEMIDLFVIPILNVIMSLTTGAVVENNDTLTETTIKGIRDGTVLLAESVIVEFFPILRFLPWGPFAKFRKYGDIQEAILDKGIKEQISTYKDGTIRHLVDAIVSEMKHTNTFDSANKERSMLALISSTIAAGTDTTGATLLWCVLYMATWPEIQKKVQDELDRVIGQDRRPTYSDKILLPYTEAVLFEVHRYASVSPAGIPRRNFEETKLRGYTIPPQTTVIQHIRAVHYDPKLWGDPEIFRPERFIDATGKAKKPEYLIPFSIGARRCIGEQLVNVELFLFFSSLLQSYHITFANGKIPPTIKPNFIVTSTPFPFSAVFKRRSNCNKK